MLCGQAGGRRHPRDQGPWPPHALTKRAWTRQALLTGSDTQPPSVSSSGLWGYTLRERSADARK